MMDEMQVEEKFQMLTSHIMKVSAAPEHPINAPTVVMMGIFNMNPSAHKAHPE